MPATPPAPGRLPSLTGLRFAAALLVFGVHAYSFIPLADPQDQRIGAILFNAGDLGVSVFFVLSGFVLTWSVRPGYRKGRFWLGRIVRVYPAHLVALILAMAGLVVSARVPDVWPQQLVGSALLVQAWHPSDVYYLGINPVTWSLSCEIAFYLAFPLLYAGLRRLGTMALRVAVVALPAAVWLMPLVAEVFVAAEHRRWFVYVFPPVRGLEFLLGIVLALLVLRGAWRGPGLPLATVLWVANYLAVDWLPAAARDTAATIVTIALLIPAAALADIRGHRSWWRDRLAVHLGEVSYAFFLVHMVMIVTVMHLLGRERLWSAPQAVALALAFLIGSYLLAVPLHRWVELPAMRLLSRPARTGPKDQHIRVPARTR
ncbi:acyltransferase family protein [Micromonospora sp. NBC_01813]|uniref:acyltransferase family protein n=1 Tax=Micromonospora sp. NBC_01813 TaxID=2975988 RepID=UPI002DD7BCE6|nr:acyltransferase [Micromonospora sp. NBC_01813]WSA11118.1 acyltransferase [Micromonospora sp. NBC_01813]